MSKTVTEQVTEMVAKLEARQAISKEALGHLSALWNSIQAEAWYDPASDATKRFAAHLKPHIDALNAELKFRS